MRRDPLPIALAPQLPARGVPAAWRAPLVSLAVLLAIVIAAYFSTAKSMVGTWANSVTYNHGFVVVPIALWLIWRARERLRVIAPRPSLPVLALFAAAGSIWLIGQFGAVNALSQLGFVAMLVLTVPAVLGIAATKTILFPLGFLFFAVPIGDFLLPTLMERTADFTVAALRASGVPVYREGFLMVLPTGRWSVVEACSGVRYLIASVMTGMLFAYLSYTALWRRIVFVGVAIVVPIIANWIRAYMIVLLGHLTNNRLAVGVDHLIYGWIFFGFVMLVMFSIGARWREPASVAATRPATDRDIEPRAPASSRNVASATLAVAVLALLWPALEYATIRKVDAPVALHAVPVPGWQALPPSDSDWEPHFEFPAATLHERLQRNGMRGGIYVAYYRNQDAQSKVANSENRLASAEGGPWLQTLLGSTDVVLGGDAVRVSSSVLRGPGGRGVLAWRWYAIDGVLTSSDAEAKARTAWSRLRGRSDDAAVIVVYVDDAESAQATQALDDLAKAAWPALSGMLSTVRSD